MEVRGSIHISPTPVEVPSEIRTLKRKRSLLSLDAWILPVHR
jgi:hypothetical protein